MNLWWLVTFASLAGVVLNIKKKQSCFIVWAGTNFMWMIRNWQLESYEQTALKGVYFLLSLWGIYEWSPKAQDFIYHAYTGLAWKIQNIIVKYSEG